MWRLLDILVGMWMLLASHMEWHHVYEAWIAVRPTRAF
jgi:hypothetical protein